MKTSLIIHIYEGTIKLSFKYKEPVRLQPFLSDPTSDYE